MKNNRKKKLCVPVAPFRIGVGRKICDLGHKTSLKLTLFSESYNTKTTIIY